MGTFKLDRIPTKIVDNVVQVSEVYQVKLVKTQANNKKDVRITNMDGKVGEMTRSQLVENLLTLEGKPIRMIRLKYNKNYTMMRISKTDCVAVRIPKECESQFIRPDGSKVPHGTVLVVPAANVQKDGSYIDMTGAREIKDALFKKLFSVTKLSSGISERLKIAVAGNKTDVNKAVSNAGKTDKGRDIEAARNNVQPQVKPVSKPVETKKPEPAKAKAVASLVDPTGACVGYRIATPDGRSAAYSVMEVAQLAKEGKLDNVKYVQSDNSKSYIAGVGCSLKELPVEPI